MADKIGTLIGELVRKRAEIEIINGKLKAAETDKSALETSIIGLMEKAGITAAKWKDTSVSVSKTVRPQLQDWEAFEKFVLRNKALYLFERRVSATAYRDMIAERKGKAVPGLSDYVHVRLNIRTAS